MKAKLIAHYSNHSEMIKFYSDQTFVACINRVGKKFTGHYSGNVLRDDGAILLRFSKDNLQILDLQEGCLYIPANWLGYGNFLVAPLKGVKSKSKLRRDYE